VTGQTASLNGTLIHSNAKEQDIDFWLSKHMKFASRAAREELLRRKGRLRWSMEAKLLGSPDERIVWFKTVWYRMPLFVRPFVYFGYRYVFRLGFLDGSNGLLFHFLHAFWYRMVIDLKLAELTHKVKTGDLSIDAVANELAASRVQVGTLTRTTP
jgi:hypothetical protein